MMWRTVFAVTLILAGCASEPDRSISSSPPGSMQSDVSTPQDAIRAYAETFLHGSPSSFYAAQVKTCRQQGSGMDVDADFARLRSTVEQLLGRKLSDVQVTRVQVRNATSDRAEAQATFNVASDLAGTDNWITLSNEGGRWLVEDCSRLPIGGSSSHVSAAATD